MIPHFRKLGQHFLINKAAIQKIIAALELKDGDTIVEIGAGHGELTKEIINSFSQLAIKKFKIIAIEKDPPLAKKLSENFQFSSASWRTNFQIITDDALKFLTHWKLKIENWKIVGNIPYYITGKLLRVIGELNPPSANWRNGKPKLIVLTVQKEVAERIIARPPKMNLLAAAVQFWAEPKIIGYLKAKDFSPPPKVDSAIIKLVTGVQPPAAKEIEKYYKLIKIIFKQPRKTLLNNLAAGWSAHWRKKAKILEILRLLGLKGDERPQNLSIKDIKKLISWG